MDFVSGYEGRGRGKTAWEGSRKAKEEGEAALPRKGWGSGRERGGYLPHLSCSCGLPGIFACLKGAATVHFQDLNAETIRCTTIPNVLANLEQARDRQSRQLESPLTPSRQTLAPAVHFFAGDWEELPTVLSVVRNDGFEVPKPTSLSFSEEDFMDGSSSQDGSIVGHESSSRRSRKLSGSRAWERASETDQGETVLW
ncbi:uncharacterized protein LOC114294344 [Camellia sinensis]|uniref:uncharacterized protein LOC114294344 n=1 Tax=Camellia sinensis TaxID=4442 RepID=UPI001035EA51|nr:uncharacterized protein LOC114294344 [Camellia sinensis]